MLTVSPLTSSSDALKYYSHGHYYGSEGEGGGKEGVAKKLNQTRRISDVIYVKKMFVGHPYL